MSIRNSIYHLSGDQRSLIRRWYSAATLSFPFPGGWMNLSYLKKNCVSAELGKIWYRNTWLDHRANNVHHCSWFNAKTFQNTDNTLLDNEIISLNHLHFQSKLALIMSFQDFIFQHKQIQNTVYIIRSSLEEISPIVVFCTPTLW